MNYERALEQQRQKKVRDRLVCPKCGERNGPGTGQMIDLEEDGKRAFCSICPHYFVVEDR